MALTFSPLEPDMKVSLLTAHASTTCELTYLDKWNCSWQTECLSFKDIIFPQIGHLLCCMILSCFCFVFETTFLTANKRADNDAFNNLINPLIIFRGLCFFTALAILHCSFLTFCSIWCQLTSFQRATSKLVFNPIFKNTDLKIPSLVCFYNMSSWLTQV